MALIAGLILILIGVGLWSVPAAFICAGLSVAALGYLFHEVD